jgi:hypothetical protein
MHDVGDYLDSDVRQLGESKKAFELVSHDHRASGATAQRGLIDQEPHHRRGGRFTSEDELPPDSG